MTINKNMGDFSQYGSTVDLLNKRRQSVLNAFNRMAPDLGPNQVNVFWDPKSLDSSIGLTGFVNQLKKQ